MRSSNRAAILEFPSDTGSENADSGSSETPAADKAGGEQASDKGADKTPQNVPLAALHEERNKRKAIDAQYRETQQQLAELRGKFSIIEKLGIAPGEAAEKPKGPIKPEDDIFGAVNAQSETVAQLQKRLDDAEAATKASAEKSTFVNNYRADANKFEQANPDYRKAYDFVLAARASELLAIGYDNPNDPTFTPQQQQQAAQALHGALMADEEAIAQLAFSKGKSPAEILYGLAKQRGYKAAAAEAPKADTGKGAEKLETIERGQAAHKSLANAGGSAGDPEITAAQLIDMPADEFEAWVNKNPAKASRIMGG
jgi:hypothetical protein